MLLAGLEVAEREAETICRWISLEMGKTINEARDEVIRGYLLPASRIIIAEARSFCGTTPPGLAADRPHRRVQIIHQPIGVTAIISPWNFPVDNLTTCIMSLMMGNACVWKPSEWAPLAPQLLAKAFTSAAIPSGVFNLVYGGPQVGELLVAHEHVGLVSFVGSTAVGEQITKTAGVKRLLLELGGNGPMIVLEDADIDRAVEAAKIGCFYQAGQICIAAERILVHERVYDEFSQKLAAAAAAIKLGDPLDETTEMGPLSELRILEKVAAHVEDAIAKGAQILTGGANRGLYYEPTVLTGVTPGMRIYEEETFGPVAPLVKIRSVEEAITLANASPYGLIMSVFTESLNTALLMAEELEAGTVNINSGTADVEVIGAFGGWKKSGYGRLSVMGKIAFAGFTNTKTITYELK
jgi:acyl-CoA reductase-like NAD-dependent aldehyde dehydrogenase